MNNNSEKKSWELVIEILSEEQVIDYVVNLGSSYPTRDNEGNLLFQSICHNSNSKKLCYFLDSKHFFCYKEWESFNIFSLTMNVLDISFKEAYQYVCNYFGIKPQNFANSIIDGFATSYVKEDWQIFEKLEEKNLREVEQDTIYHNVILSFYSRLYHEDWIKEHISIESMKKFGIRFNIVDNCIVIPHYDVNQNLVGIRGRFLNQDAYAKYMPLSIENTTYSHSLTNHLYGLWENKETIQKLGKTMIVESEKSVLQSETYFPNNNFTIACCGKNISNEHIRLLLDLGINEVLLGFDSDFVCFGDNEKYLEYRLSILKKAKKLIPYFMVYNIGAYSQESIFYKNSPTDNGKDVLLGMMKNKEWLCSEKVDEEIQAIQEKLKMR